jgi:small-conductance mechanosensitive channel
MGFQFENWESLFWLVVAVMAGLLVHAILFWIAVKISKRTKTLYDNSIVKQSRGPVRIIIPLLFIQLVLPFFSISETLDLFIKQATTVCFISSLGWLLINLTHVAEEFFLSRFNIDIQDNLRARGIQTQFRIFKKIIIVVLVVLTVAVILITFEKIRYLGTSILASAGIAGIVIGLAAQRSLGTILAGIQIAITQPIRIDDVLIVENEWGRVEEINLTYVVIRIWDLRRLILPITYFIEKPFQNWTRTRADILGTVYIYTDYTIPVEEIREELQTILNSSGLWDGRVWGLQVTNTTERTMELRALMSAEEASQAWNLRCHVREKLVDFIQQKYPECLPALRTRFFKEEGHHPPAPKVNESGWIGA